jgi:glycosyltransferase involved in cell wall biosynthesis
VTTDRGIAFLLGNLTVGGSETKIVRLANRLAAKEFDVHVIALGGPYTLRPLISPDVHVQCLDRQARYSPRTLRRLKTYLARHEIRATVCVNTYPLVYGWPARVLLGRQNNTCLAAINTSEHTTLRDRLFMMLYAPILRRCDRVIFGSHGQAGSWIRRYGIDQSRTTVIHNGVDTEYFARDDGLRDATRNDLAIGETSCVIGCVAQFRPEKSHVNLIEAFAGLDEPEDAPRAVLLLVGDGPEETRLRRLVSREGLEDRVRFVGRVEDVRPFLNAMDVFVLPSTSVEVFSNAALEAMATGVPVISSDTGGATEMIRDGVDGLIYPRHDVECLKEKLRTLIDDVGLRESFRRNAIQRLHEEFTLDQMDAAYTDIIAGPGAES